MGGAIVQLSFVYVLGATAADLPQQTAQRQSQHISSCRTVRNLILTEFLTSSRRSNKPERLGRPTAMARNTEF